MNPKRKNLKRWFSILLTIIFCFTLMPATALAAGTKSQLDTITANWNKTVYSQSNSYTNTKYQYSGAYQCQAFSRYIFNNLYGHTDGLSNKNNTVTITNHSTASSLLNQLKTIAVPGDAIRVTSSYGGSHIMHLHQVDNSNRIHVYESNFDGSTNQGRYYVYPNINTFLDNTMRYDKKKVTVTNDALSHTVELIIIHSKKNTATNTTPAAQTVQVMFNGNGGTVSESSRTIIKGSALGSFPKATRSGYTLKGWYSTTTATASSKVTESQKLNSNMTLYAVWSKNATTTTNTTTSAATKTYYVKGTDGTLVMRKGPGSNYAQQTLIPEGASVKVTPSKNSGSWWYVTYNGKSGYSYSSYLTTTAPKATQLIKDGTYTLSPKHASNMCLDINGASKNDGANAQIYKANGSNAQKFKIKHLGNDYYSITCVASGKALDVKGASTKKGTNVQQWTKNDTKAQKWKIKSTGNGYYCLLPATNEKLCLDVTGSGTKNKTNVLVWTYNNQNNQNWKLTKV